MINKDDPLKLKKYESILQLNTQPNENLLLYENLFTAVSELIDIDFILDKIVEKDIQSLKYQRKLKNKNNNNPEKSEEYQLYTSINEMRMKLLRFCRNFNICVYNSKDPKLTERVFHILK